MAFKRKTYLIKKSFQLRIMAKVFFLMTVMIFAIFTALYLSNKKEVKNTHEIIGDFLVKYTLSSNKFVGDSETERSGSSLLWEARNMAESINAQMNRLGKFLYTTTFIAVLLTTVLVLTLFLVISHRIAGPVYRFEQTLESLLKGDLTVRVSLRDKDELKEVADAFNEATVSLNDKLKTIKDLSSKIDKLMASGISDENKSQIKGHSDSLKNIISTFKLT